MFETVVFIFLAFWAINWQMTGWLNILAKMCFSGMAIWSAFQALQYWGYLVKIPP